MKANLNKDWKVTILDVRETILDVYSSSIANYSATGKRANRPAINPMLFKGLYGKYTHAHTCARARAHTHTHTHVLNVYILHGVIVIVKITL